MDGLNIKRVTNKMMLAITIQFRYTNRNYQSQRCQNTHIFYPCRTAVQRFSKMYSKYIKVKSIPLREISTNHFCAKLTEAHVMFI